ncbi:hypothetical protein [Rhodococcus sp. X156]|uniref:hypothetical protein n=1 Tax=Rhodococcus sp. X156 TaxID=2499145 RepID=UPI000FDA4226|nr:hypothetical protein [Rhodococcus sp. X156]
MSDESPNNSQIDETSAALLHARAVVLHDIVACGADVPGIVDVLDAAVHEREWWVRRWPEGMQFLAGQVAQDVQDRLVDTEGRWPPCPVHPDEALQLEPPLGADPRWVCGRGCGEVAALGALSPQSGSEAQGGRS